jgi:hypothetical protein
LPKLVEHFAVTASGVRVDGPHADVVHELAKSAANLADFGELLNAGFQLAQNGETRYEPMAAFALLVNSISQRRNFA